MSHKVVQGDPQRVPREHQKKQGKESKPKEHKTERTMSPKVAQGDSQTVPREHRNNQGKESKP